MNGPAVKPAEKAAPISPMRPARRSGGVMSARAPCSTEMLPAKMPFTNRMAKAAHRLGAKAKAA